MKATLTREHWKTVYRALDNTQSPSPLKPAIAEAGKATDEMTFTVEGSYYDFAEVVSLILGDDPQLANRISLTLSLELWDEVLANQQ